jgi:hypothetical protein
MAQNKAAIAGIGWAVAWTLLCFPAHGQIPPIPSAAQRSIERIVGATGSYVANESVFKMRIPRKDIALNLQGQLVTGGFPMESWVSFSPEIRGGALMMSELRLLEVEVNPVASAVLDAGLNINGLAGAMIFDQPRLMTMNISGTGTFDQLATGIRKSLDAIAAVRIKTSSVRTAFPRTSAIDGAAIDTILSMKGTVTNGVYRASIGQIAVLNNTPFGKEMGAATSITLVGTNQNAILDGEIVATTEQLQRVLKALRRVSSNYLCTRRRATNFQKSSSTTKPAASRRLNPSPVVKT